MSPLMIFLLVILRKLFVLQCIVISGIAKYQRHRSNQGSYRWLELFNLNNQSMDLNGGFKLLFLEDVSFVMSFWW